MQDYFYTLADTLTALLHSQEMYTCAFRGEESDFVRFNRSAVRQPGTVTQRFLNLDLYLKVCAEGGVFNADLREALIDRFSSGRRRDGQLGFFHPDNLTFGFSDCWPGATALTLPA